MGAPADHRAALSGLPGSAWASRPWTAGVLLVIALGVLVFAFQGTRGLFAPDEGVYVAIAQTMNDTGDFVVPHLHGEPYLDKPPLSLWGIAAGLRLMGDNEWGARAFHGICFLLTIAGVFLLGRMMGGMPMGVTGAVIFATMLMPFVAGNIVTPDFPLTICTTMGFLCFWKSIRPETQRVFLWRMLLAASLGLAFLAKGPAAFLPAGAMFCYLLLRGEVRRYLLSPWIVPGLALFATLGLGWYALVSFRVPGALAYFWDNQVWGRTVATHYARYPGLWGGRIYAGVLLGGALPWAVGWAGWVRRQGGEMLRASWWLALRNDPNRLLLAVWIAAPLAVLCLANSKLHLYVLPLFPAIALSTARLYTVGPSGGGWRNNPFGLSKVWVAALGVWVVLLPGLKLAAAHYPSSRNLAMLHGALVGALPEGPCEIISVNEHLYGLGFYTDMPESRVTTRTNPYPIFSPPAPLDDKIVQMGTARTAQVFIVKNENYAAFMRGKLSGAGIHFREHPLPFGRKAFICLRPVE